MEKIAGSTHHGGHSEVTDEHDLTSGVASAGGNNSSSEHLCTVVCAETSGEETVAVRDLNDIIFAETGTGKTAVHHFVPDVDIIFRVSHNDGFSGGSARGVETDYLALWNCKESEGISITQIGLFHKGQFCKNLEFPDIARLEFEFIHAASEESDILISMADNVLQFAKLHLAKIRRIDKIF